MLGAEYIALHAGAKQLVWLRRFFFEPGQGEFLLKNPGK